MLRGSDNRRAVLQGTYASPIGEELPAANGTL
jgi:hypothetical protein